MSEGQIINGSGGVQRRRRKGKGRHDGNRQKRRDKGRKRNGTRRRARRRERKDSEAKEWREA